MSKVKMYLLPQMDSLMFTFMYNEKVIYLNSYCEYLNLYIHRQLIGSLGEMLLVPEGSAAVLSLPIFLPSLGRSSA